jgi:hypothetical protein
MSTTRYYPGLDGCEIAVTSEDEFEGRSVEGNARTLLHEYAPEAFAGQADWVGGSIRVQCDWEGSLRSCVVYWWEGGGSGARPCHTGMEDWEAQARAFLPEPVVNDFAQAVADLDRYRELLAGAMVRDPHAWAEGLLLVSQLTALVADESVRARIRERAPELIRSTNDTLRRAGVYLLGRYGTTGRPLPN